MPVLLCDASGLAKRYVAEHGSETVNALFDPALGLRMAVTLIGYSETYSIVRRRFNGGQISRAQFALAASALQLEVIESLLFELIPTDSYVLQSLALIDRHNINATDAAILAAYLDYKASLPPDQLSAILVASDHRLLRAAEAEGLATTDPEVAAAIDVPNLLKTL